MSDFIFANPVKKDHVDVLLKYMELFNLSKDEAGRLELITNTLASDLAATKLVTITETENNQWLLQIVPSRYRVANEIHKLVTRYIDGGATINPDKALVKIHLVKKEYAQFVVKWLHDYKVDIKEFSYPIDNFS